MQRLLVSIFVLALCACGSDKNNSGSGGKSGGGNENAKPVTKASDCVFGKKALGLLGGWATKFESTSFQFFISFDFQANGVLKMSNQCITPSGDVTATIYSPYQDNGSSISIPANASHQATVGKTTCSVNLNKGSMKYRLENACLVMTGPDGSEIYFTPAY